MLTKQLPTYLCFKSCCRKLHIYQATTINRNQVTEAEDMHVIYLKQHLNCEHSSEHIVKVV